MGLAFIDGSLFVVFKGAKMAWYHFGSRCPYVLALCQERSGCYGCQLYLDHVEGVNEVKAEANEVRPVYRAGLLGVPGLQITRKEVV